MNVYLAWIATILYWIIFPVYFILYYLVIALGLLVRPLLSVLFFVLAPFAHIAHFLGQCALWPIHFLQRFETMYMYLGVASIIGIASGLVLHFLYGSIYTALRLYPKPKHNGRTIEDFREDRRKRIPDEPGIIPPTPPESPAKDFPRRGRKTRRSLAAQIIHEEDVSDF